MVARSKSPGRKMLPTATKTASLAIATGTAASSRIGRWCGHRGRSIGYRRTSPISRGTNSAQAYQSTSRALKRPSHGTACPAYRSATPSWAVVSSASAVAVMPIRATSAGWISRRKEFMCCLQHACRRGDYKSSGNAVGDAPGTGGNRLDVPCGIPREAQLTTAVVADEEIGRRGNPALPPQGQRSVRVRIDTENRFGHPRATAAGEARQVIARVLRQARRILGPRRRHDRRLLRGVQAVEQGVLDLEPQVAAFAVVHDEEAGIFLRDQHEQRRETA